MLITKLPTDYHLLEHPLETSWTEAGWIWWRAIQPFRSLASLAPWPKSVENCFIRMMLHHWSTYHDATAAVPSVRSVNAPADGGRWRLALLRSGTPLEPAWCDFENRYKRPWFSMLFCGSTQCSVLCTDIPRICTYVQCMYSRYSMYLPCFWFLYGGYKDSWTIFVSRGWRIGLTGPSNWFVTISIWYSAGFRTKSRMIKGKRTLSKGALS